MDIILLFVRKDVVLTKTMMDTIKRRLSPAVPIAAAALFLAACGGGSEDVSTVRIDAQGEVSSVVFDDFSESYYDIDELKEMAVGEIDTFNADYITPRVFFEEAELVNDGTTVKLSMNYKTAKDYTDFNGSKLFFGTVEEAKEKGYTISDKLVSRKGDTIDVSVVDEQTDRHVIITNDKSNIIAPYNIEYMSGGVELIGKKEAVLSSTGEEEVQLLLSK